MKRKKKNMVNLLKIQVEFDKIHFRMEIKKG